MIWGDQVDGSGALDREEVKMLAAAVSENDENSALKTMKCVLKRGIVH